MDLPEELPTRLDILHMDINWSDSQFERCASFCDRPTHFSNMFCKLNHDQKLCVSVHIVDIYKDQMPAVVANEVFEFIYANVSDWYDIFSIKEATGFVLGKMPDMSESHLAKIIARSIAGPKHVYSTFTNVMCAFLAARPVDAIDRVCRHINFITESNIYSNPGFYSKAIDISVYITHPLVGPIFKRLCANSFVALLTVRADKYTDHPYRFNDSILDFVIAIAKERSFNGRSVPDILYRAFRYSMLELVLRKHPPLCYLENDDGTTILKYVLDHNIRPSFRTFIFENTYFNNVPDIEHLIRFKQAGNELVIGNELDLSNVTTAHMQFKMREVYYSVKFIANGNLKRSMSERKFGSQYLFPSYMADQIFNSAVFNDIRSVVHDAHKIVKFRNPFYLCAKNVLFPDARDCIMDFLSQPVNLLNAKSFLQDSYSWCHETRPRSMASFEVIEVDDFEPETPCAKKKRS